MYLPLQQVAPAVARPRGLCAPLSVVANFSPDYNLLESSRTSLHTFSMASGNAVVLPLHLPGFRETFRKLLCPRNYMVQWWRVQWWPKVQNQFLQKMCSKWANPRIPLQHCMQSFVHLQTCMQLNFRPRLCAPLRIQLLAERGVLRDQRSKEGEGGPVQGIEQWSRHPSSGEAVAGIFFCSQTRDVQQVRFFTSRYSFFFCWCTKLRSNWIARVGKCQRRGRVRDPNERRKDQGSSVVMFGQIGVLFCEWLGFPVFLLKLLVVMEKLMIFRYERTVRLSFWICLGHVKSIQQKMGTWLLVIINNVHDIDSMCC